jgi:DivIVA domain-containing protein
MADLVSPDQVRSRSFRTTFRGFDQSEVAEFLDRIARTIESLDAERERLLVQSGEPDDGDLRSEFQRVAAEVGEVLEAARIAAEGMRERAAAEVAEWRRAAEEDSRSKRAAAQSDAEALRGDAWATSKAMLDQSLEAAKVIAAEAEREALAIVGHSERESHRSQAAARREADEQIRTAKMESERLLVDARAQHDEIIDTARKQADAAQERARALEVRRDELLAELETVRSTIHTMKTEIEDRREPVPSSSSHPPTVRLIPAEKTEPGPDLEKKERWSPPDSVKIIPAAPKPSASDEPVDAASLADEVRRLRDEAALAELAGESGEGEDESPVEVEVPVPSAENEPEVDDDDVVTDSLEVVEVEEVEETPEPVAAEETWALDSLFATLRSEPEEEQDVPSAATEYPPEPVPAEVMIDEPPSVGGEAGVADANDAIAGRDHLLLPITNRVLRGVKRQLTEAQNLTLEDVRVNERWDPDSVDLAERVRGDLMVLVQESYAAGQSTAGSILGVETGRPKPAKLDVPDHSEEFAAGLKDALANVAGSAGEQGPRALSASLSRVYRAWRTDEAERRLREYASTAFHRGILAGAASAGASTVSWVLAGRGCTSCRAAAKAGSVAINSDFPGVDGVPPVHPGCRCTIVPV